MPPPEPGPAPAVPLPAAVHAAVQTAVPSPRGAHHRAARTWRVLTGAFVAVALVVLALALGALVSSQTGATGFLLGTALATLPLPLLIGAFLWLDRHEPEPAALLVLAFLWGAVVAALASALVNSASLVAIAQASERDSGLATTAVFVAPVVEEATKGFGVLVVLLARRREFDGVVDGIVFAGLVGLGFAFTENVLYYGRAYLEADAEVPGSGVLAAGVTFVLRGVLSPFAHPLFTIMTGIGIGVAVGTRRPVLRWGAPLLGYAAAVALHMSWNLSAVSGLSGFLSGYVMLMLPIFLVAVGVALWARAREGRAIAAVLPAYAAVDWMPSYDVAMVASPGARRRARRWAGQTQGPGAGRRMRDYQEAAAEVALLRWRAERDLRVPGFAERECRLLLDLERARRGFSPVLR